jgi:O-antigen/teichoic acid export membrane protein
MFIPGAVAGVLFAVASTGKPSQGVPVSARSSYLLLIPTFVIPLTALAVFANPFLTWWVNDEVAVEAAPLLQILLLGVIANGAAHIPFAVIQARGRPDITAKLHLAEAIAYVPGLWFLIGAWGAAGAAVAWAARVVVDAMLLFALSRRASRQDA